jgi:riboflavin kinase / FMN adenylyltransferase
MKTHVIQSLDRIPRFEHTAVTVGNFDGVHTGHRAVIRQLESCAGARGLDPVVITFHPHHRVFFGHADAPFLLTDLDEKLLLLQDTPLAHVVVLPFSHELAEMTAEEFTAVILRDHLDAKCLLVGHDQAMGRNQRRGAELREVAHSAGMDTHTLDPVIEGDETVSSTAIRRAVGQGDVDTANRLAGYPYIISGYVESGDKRGRTLGYPTANVRTVDPFKLIPADGIYIADVRIAAQAPGLDTPAVTGMLYVGTRPTFYGNGERVIEVSLLDFDGDIYDRHVRVSVLSHIRDDMKFNSADELTAQMTLDEQATRKYINRLK